MFRPVHIEYIIGKKKYLFLVQIEKIKKIMAKKYFGDSQIAKFGVSGPVYSDDKKKFYGGVVTLLWRIGE